jgi:hypothetical protein
VTGLEGTIDAGLLTRFRAAGPQIAWRPAPAGRGKGPRARIAHLHDEECRVVRRGREGSGSVAVESGPLGALVLLLEMDRHGLPRDYGAGNAGRDPGYPGGFLEASWGALAVAHDTKPTLRDLVELARYALA